MINDKTYTYIKIETNYQTGELFGEWGTKTQIANNSGEVTSMFGLKTKEPDNYWSEVNLSNYRVEYNANALHLVPDIIYENEWVVPGIPMPVPSPIPAIGGMENEQENT